MLEDDCLNVPRVSVLLHLPLTSSSSPPSRCDSETSGSWLECDQCGETFKTGRTLSVHGEKSFKMRKTVVEIMAVMEVIMRSRVDMVVEMVAVMIMNFAPTWRSMISICSVQNIQKIDWPVQNTSMPVQNTSTPVQKTSTVLNSMTKYRWWVIHMPLWP